MSQSKWLYALLICACIGFSGCIPIAYVIPKYNSLPAEVQKECDSDCTIVQFEEKEDGTCFEPDSRPMPTIQMKKIELPRQGNPPQSLGRWTFRKSYSWFPFYYGRYSRERILYRLYRPGYQTMEVNSWPWSTTVRWVSVKNFEEREMAIDALWECSNSTALSHIWLNNAWEKDWSGKEEPDGLQQCQCLNFCTFTPESAAMLQWLANEYEQLKQYLLSTSTPVDKYLLRRLTNKAQYCREQAAQLQER